MPGNTLTNRYLRDVMTPVFVSVDRKVAAQVSGQIRQAACRCRLESGFLGRYEDIVMDDIENRVREEVDVVWDQVSGQIAGPV